MIGGTVQKGSYSMTRGILNSPLIVVVGATGTGKSKLQLAVSLALKFNGEIINGDAIQMYKGLPIVTNKIPEDERKGIPHHLLDFIGLEKQPWTVRQFVKEADRIINEIRGRGKLPIVVGGTHYYVHGLLFKDALVSSLESENESLEKAEESNPADGNSECGILGATTEEMYAKLQSVDPEMATRWHPKDRRHIRRSLEIWLTTGRKASEIYNEQKQERAQSEALTVAEDDMANTQKLRYDPLILWLAADDGTLKARLDQRVDTMMEQGLLNEVEKMKAFEAEHTHNDSAIDKSKGVWVAIGYKEMEPWLKAQMDSPQTDTGLSALRNSCIEAVKAGTRQYAKRQHRFVRLRLHDALADAGKKDLLFLLDSTDLDRWAADLECSAFKLVQAFLGKHDLPDPASISQLARRTFEGMEQSRDSTRIAHYCDTCRKTLMSNQEWSNHLKSRGHKKAVEGRQKWETNQKWLAKRQSGLPDAVT